MKTLTAQIASMSLVAASFAAPAMAAEVALAAHLTGAAEKPAAGDPDGQGHATLKVDAAKSQVCYTMMVEKIAPATMAHIHKAAADAAGPVALPLSPPDAAGKSSGCATADAALVTDMLANPGGYYVNVHNADFRAGAVRGQLTK